jgi:hypothetical protein
VSIVDIQPDTQYEKSMKDILNSPRSLEACLRVGIELTDLDPILEETVRQQLVERERKPNIPKVLIDMRMKHNEEKRREKIRLIKEVIFYLEITVVNKYLFA